MARVHVLGQRFDRRQGCNPHQICAERADDGQVQGYRWKERTAVRNIDIDAAI